MVQGQSQNVSHGISAVIYRTPYGIKNLPIEPELEPTSTVPKASLSEKVVEESHGIH